MANGVVVGHAIEEFDLPVLRHAAERNGLAFRQPAAIDVFRLAKRIWPDEMSYRIEDLARKIDPSAVQTHRAGDDCRLTGILFARLLQDARRDRELDVLSECLPLVAGAINGAGGVVAYDDYLLVGIWASVRSRLGKGGSLSRRLGRAGRPGHRGGGAIGDAGDAPAGGGRGRAVGAASQWLGGRRQRVREQRAGRRH